MVAFLDWSSMKKILIIEDEYLISYSLKKLIETKGFEVDIEASGINALEQIANNNYFKIVCDLMLQDISGFDVIEGSKSKYSPYDISSKFVIITAYATENILQKAKDYNCPVLNKPFQNIHNALDIILHE
jgi:CheY-like chemotaxis protein